MTASSSTGRLLRSAQMATQSPRRHRSARDIVLAESTTPGHLTSALKSSADEETESAYQAAGPRHPRLRPQDRLQARAHRAIGRHRFGAGRGHRLRCARAGKRAQPSACPSQYSSGGSVDDSRILAANLGMRFEILPIAGLFEGFTGTLGPLFADTKSDLTEENLQSRIRGTLMMALSNKFGSLVLTTGNKSEMAVGYCTLYGDNGRRTCCHRRPRQNPRLRAQPLGESRTRNHSRSHPDQGAFRRTPP